jgi:hypothetical protein
LERKNSHKERKKDKNQTDWSGRQGTLALAQQSRTQTAIVERRPPRLHVTIADAARRAVFFEMLV